MNSESSTSEIRTGLGMVDQMTGMVGEKIDGFVPLEVRKKLKVPFTERLWVLMGYLAIGSLLAWGRGWGIVGFWVGGTLGFYLLDTDHLLDVFFLNSEKEINKRVRDAISLRDWHKVWGVLLETAASRDKLVLHSVVFEFIVVILSLYVIFSASNLFSIGLVLCFWLRILYEQFREYKSTQKIESWLWQIKGEIPKKFHKLVLSGGVLVWVFLNFIGL